MGNMLLNLVKKKGKDQMTNIPTSFWDLEADDIQGKKIKFSELKGKKLYLIVNVASACGLTNSNYRQLKKFHKQYNEHGLHIMGFPCNQFKQQESGCNADIEEVVRTKFKIQFQMFSKIEVNGQNCHPVYKFLRRNSDLWIDKEGKAKEIPWNFAKFLVNADGNVVKYYSSEITPKTFQGEIEEILEYKKE